jgi:acyl-CoA synthetase (AMP-forming)/AMP-acid ligase II
MAHTARWCADARIRHPTFVCLAEYPFQNLLFGSRQDIENHRIIQGVPTYQHYSFVGICPRHMRPSQLQRAIRDSYDIFFARAMAAEQRPQRRMRLKAYARSVALGKDGMERHIQFLEALEKPYYTPSGELWEERLVEMMVENEIVGGVAACGLSNAEAKTESLHLLIEQRVLPPPDQATVEERIRHALEEAFGLTGVAIHWVAKGQIPKTTSGKIQRYRCRRFIEGSLR